MRARRSIVKGMDFFDDLSGSGIAIQSVIPIGEALRVTRKSAEFSTTNIGLQRKCNDEKEEESK